jgi:hypothetical protein
MDIFLLPALLLVLSLILYVEELMAEHPDRLKAAIYVLALITSFISITLTLKNTAG